MEVRAFTETTLSWSAAPAVALEQVRGDDGVGDAGLVLEAQEEKTLGCAGTLAADDAAGDARPAAVLDTR